MVAKMLDRPALVLNRNWQPVNVATVARALVLLWNEAARVVDCEDYQTYTWEDWSALRPREGGRVHPSRAAASARARGDRAGRLRPTAGGRRQLQPPQYLQAGPLGLPVLRPPTGRRRVVDRPRRAAVAGRPVDLGQLRAGVHEVQQAEGRPHAGASTDEAPHGAGPPALEANVRPAQRTDRKLVEVRQRSVLERELGTMIAK